MATSLTLQNDPISPQGYLKVNGTTAATITESGLSMSTLNSINVDDYIILSDFIGANRSLVTPSGFQKLPGGLIINWGRANIAGEGSVVLNYAQSFTGEVLGVSVAALGTVGDNWALIGAFPTSLTQILLSRNWSGAGTNETNWCFYIAIGY